MFWSVTLLLGCHTSDAEIFRSVRAENDTLEEHYVLLAPSLEAAVEASNKSSAEHLRAELEAARERIRASEGDPELQLAAIGGDSFTRSKAAKYAAAMQSRGVLSIGQIVRAGGGLRRDELHVVTQGPKRKVPLWIDGALGTHLCTWEERVTELEVTEWLTEDEGVAQVVQERRVTVHEPEALEALRSSLPPRMHSASAPGMPTLDASGRGVSRCDDEPRRDVFRVRVSRTDQGWEAHSAVKI